MEQVLQFLSDLSRNNHRDWFKANYKRYSESREKMRLITEILINEIRKFDPGIPAMDPKDCMFRIFRDVRFSKDKRPYKTNFGSFIAPGGRKSPHAGYYLHIDPAGSFAGGGIYMPSAGPLKVIREQIVRDPDTFLQLTGAPEFKSFFPGMMDHRLKTAPRGYPKDHQNIDLLRYKSFVFSTVLDKEALLHGDFLEKTVGAFFELQKVNAWLNEALKDF